MSEQEYFLAWCDIQRLVDNALGLAMLGNYDCASSILDLKENRLASDSVAGAAVVLLQQASTLLESMDPDGLTFKAEETEQP